MTLKSDVEVGSSVRLFGAAHRHIASLIGGEAATESEAKAAAERVLEDKP